MDFDLSQEQRLLQDSVAKVVTKQYGFEQRLKYQQQENGWSAQIWSLFAEQGFLALPFSGVVGGLEMGPVEMMLLMEEMGKGLIVEPYLSTVVAAGHLLKCLASDQQRAQILPKLIQGRHIIVPAVDEPQSRYCLNTVSTSAGSINGGYVLNGIKSAVEHGNGAQQYIVSARTAGELSDCNGISLFLVDANTPGVMTRAFKQQDGISAVDLTLRDVSVSAACMLGAPGAGYIALESARETVIAAIAAESVGAMSAVLQLTIDFLRQRQQFGKPIGAFQALQHRAAEMLIEIEQARSAAVYAALMLGEEDTDKRSRAISEVKWQIDRSARVVAQSAVQLHGGIGVSEEASVGHYFRRLTMLGLRYGDSDYHANRLCVLSRQIHTE
jgi:alkylation response protein AidB-like acyl-CoA dehydrogenase